MEKRNDDSYLELLGIIKQACERGGIGINDPNALESLENLCGEKIKLYNKPDPTRMDPEYLTELISHEKNSNQQPAAPTPGQTVDVNNQKMKVVKIELPGWMNSIYTDEEMYREAVRETKQAMRESPVLGKKNFGQDAQFGWKDWCTPELFTYLSRMGSRAEAELRAAVWPAKVSFVHRLFKSDDRIWIVPYLTLFLDNYKRDRVGKEESTISFYLNKNNEVHAMVGRVQDVFDVEIDEDYDYGRVKSLVTWRESGAELRHRVVYPETGKIQYALVKFEGTEKALEKHLGSEEKWGAGNTYKWCQWRDVTDYYKNGIVDYNEYWASRSTPEITKSGREAIANLQHELRREDNQKYFSGDKRFDPETRKSWTENWEEYSRDGDILVIVSPGCHWGRF